MKYLVLGKINLNQNISVCTAKSKHFVSDKSEIKLCLPVLLWYIMGVVIQVLPVLSLLCGPGCLDGCSMDSSHADQFKYIIGVT